MNLSKKHEPFLAYGWYSYLYTKGYSILLIILSSIFNIRGTISIASHGTTIESLTHWLKNVFFMINKILKT